MALSYALLMLPIGPDMDHDSVASLGPDLITWRGNLLDVIDRNKLTSWKDAFGLFAWSDMTADHRFVLTWADPWSDNLPMRLMVAQHAMKLLKLVTPFHGITHRLSGAAKSIEPVKLEGISSHEAFAEIPRPSYARQEDYYSAYYNPENEEPDLSWFCQWSELVANLDKIRLAEKPLILRNAIGSFERGLTHRDVEARIPELVRAAEAIIALPRLSGGVPVFVRRAMHFVADLATDPYLLAGGSPTLPQSHIAPGKQGQTFLAWYDNPATTNIERWLAVLYGHRSDCVHGKVPFEELRQIGGGDPEAARFDWLAEHLARRVIRYALSETDKWIEFEDRSTLEDAWRPSDPKSKTPRLP